MEARQGQEKCFAFFLSCVFDGIEMPMLWATHEKAFAFRAVELALREGPRPWAAKRTEEQIVDVPALRFQEKTVEAGQFMPQELVKERRKEQIVDVPLLQLQEDPVLHASVDLVRLTPREQVQQRTAEPHVSISEHNAELVDVEHNVELVGGGSPAVALELGVIALRGRATCAQQAERRARCECWRWRARHGKRCTSDAARHCRQRS